MLEVSWYEMIFFSFLIFLLYWVDLTSFEQVPTKGGDRRLNSPTRLASHRGQQDGFSV
jgi:hypothetical protein